MESTTHKWFQSEVLFWRSLASIIWSALLVPIILVLFSSLSAFSIIHPLQWMCDSLFVPFGSTFWFTALVVAICLLTVAWFSLPHFSVVADINATPLNASIGLFRWSRLPLLTVSSVTGALTAWSLSRIIGSEYRSLTQVWVKNTIEHQVLNEYHFFLVLAGSITGVYAHWQFFHSHQYYLQFSHVQRFKLFHIRSEILDLLLSSLWHSFQVVKYYYIFYFILGDFFKSWMNDSFYITVNTEVIQVNSFLGILNLNLLWQTYLCTFLIVFSWSLARTIIRIFLTDHMEFIIYSMLEQDKDRSLATALACSFAPLLQHLAFLDLSFLARFSRSRRQELFSLSQPGGHPRTWVSVSSTAVNVVNELVERIKEENWLIMSKVSLSGQNINDQSFFSGRECSQSTPEDFKLSLAFSKLNSTLNSLPVVSCLVAEYPDLRSRVVFAPCQLHIWAVEALSQIAAKAITEDKYGVVQGGLPIIFSTLLDLYEVTEKHFKLSSTVFRKYNTNENLPDALLRFKLHSTTKTALYRLVNTYKKYLEDLRLHQDYFRKLQPFIDYLV
ncbi:hypothetical protein Btru_076769 [Bulinus truncatus]|nr:hypothetical protein Btru_076769 [Bulinus truncatus]